MSRIEGQSSGARTRWWVGGGILLIAAAIAGYFLWPESWSGASDTEARAPAPPAAPARPKTLPEMLADGVRTDIRALDASDIRFTDVRIEDGRAFDYPEGTRVVYLKLAVQERVLGLLERADRIGGKFFRRAFDAAPDITAVYIDFVGPTPDRYGHLYNAPWISFVMGRRTYAKIDWAGFDVGSLCEFLAHEHVYDSDSRTFCGTKGEI